MMSTILALISFAVPILALVGLLAVAAFIFLKLPIPQREGLAWRIWDKMTATLFPSRLIMILRKDDGDYSLREAEYDSKNQGYWVDDTSGESRVFFQSAHHQAGSFGPFKLISAYEGFGAVGDFISGKIAEAFESAYIHGKDDNLNKDDDGNPIETQITIPERGIIDISKIRYIAPFSADPDRYYRIQQNTKASMLDFRQRDQLIYMGTVLAAFLLGAIITYFAMTQGAGGGGMPSVSI